ncbi:MAG: hypothetical protein ACKO22_08670 [Cyanobium sp.]
MTRLRGTAPVLALGAALVLAGAGMALARPNPGGLGGPASGAGVRLGAGFGAPGASLVRP